MEKNILWYEVYQKIADKLFEISQNEKLPSEFIYDKLIKDVPRDNLEFPLSHKLISFKDSNPWIDKFENLKSIDPIHLFASLNPTGIKDGLRMNRINAILRVFDMQEIHEMINFEGCPTPVVVKTLSQRSDTVQHDIWDMFSKVMNSKNMELPDLSKEFIFASNRIIPVSRPCLSMQRLSYLYLE